jgi:glycerol-3-phosphate dehydrogenase (NAD(P)+)
MATNSITIIGTGSWGLALAISIARNGYTVKMWGNDQDEITELSTKRCNSRCFPHVYLPDNILIYSDLAAALDNTNNILIVVPSVAFHSVLFSIKNLTKTKIEPNNLRISWATKGLADTNQPLHEIVQELFGAIPLAIISGPSFAREVVQGLPTALTAAASDPTYAQDLAKLLHSESFRIYTSNDVIGVEICGAVKNVLAIGVGIADGMQLGSNARAALITRGIAELTRLGKALGGKLETFMGLAGIGDLILTCTDNQSRNRSFGLTIGRAGKFAPISASSPETIEGYPNARAVFLLAQNHHVEMPICEQVYRILYENLSPQAAVKILLTRTQKPEF